MALFNLPKPKADLSRNGFDKSRRDTFSLRLGELLPVFCEETVENSYYEIRASNYIQTLPLFTNSFVRLKQNLEFYFVPYTAIWSRFNEFYTGRLYRNQSNSQIGLNFVPNFNLGNLLNYLRYFDNLSDSDVESKGFTKDDIFDIVAGTCKLLDMLGYGAYYSLFRHGHYGRVQEHSDQSGQTDYRIMKIANHTYSQYPNLFRLAAYQCVFNAFYRNRYWDTHDYVNAFNFDDFYNNLIADSDLLQSREGYARSYQGDWNQNIWGYFNSENPFMIRYRGYKKDRFMGLFPFPQYGDVSRVELTEFHTEDFGNVSRTLITQNGQIRVTGQNRTVYGSSTRDTYSGSASTQIIAGQQGASDTGFFGSFDVYALRKAEMMQKWRETLLRAGNVTSDQHEAVFGVKPKFDRSLQPVFLGSYDSPIKVSEVISTANTASPEDMDYSEYSNLGERAGKADSGINSNDVIKFTASDFGIIIGIASIVPENEYNATMLDDANTYSVKEDFFNPMWQNLGFRETARYSLSNLDCDADAAEGLTPAVEDENTNFNRILGFAPPYIGYKTVIDKVHGRFMSKWSQLYDYQPGETSNSDTSYGDYYFYNAPRNDLQYGVRGQFMYPLMPRLFYINPSLMKPVFVDQDEQENFLVCQYIDVKAVQPISVLGLAQW